MSKKTIPFFAVISFIIFLAVTVLSFAGTLSINNAVSDSDTYRTDVDNMMAAFFTSEPASLIEDIQLQPNDNSHDAVSFLLAMDFF